MFKNSTLKFSFVLIFIFLLFVPTISIYATDIVSGETTLQDNFLGEEGSSVVKKESIYVFDKSDYTFDSVLMGNVFALVNSFKMVSNSNNSTVTSGIIDGNLYVIGKTVHLTSDVSFNEDSSMNVTSASIITGNVFIIANSVTIEPGVEIREGDLYIIADSIDLKQNSIIEGNLFSICKSINLECQINKDAYIYSSNFVMPYYGIVKRDLNVSSEVVEINGLIHRNAYIKSKTVTLLSDSLINSDLKLRRRSCHFFWYC